MIRNAIILKDDLQDTRDFLISSSTSEVADFIIKSSPDKKKNCY